jgi:hypothetical protein
MKRLLKVESSNVTKLGHYCNKLVCKTQNTVNSAFGTTTSESQETYYLFTGNQNKVGFEAELDISQFDLVTKPFAVTKEDGTQETVLLKYLYPIR